MFIDLNSHGIPFGIVIVISALLLEKLQLAETRRLLSIIGPGCPVRSDVHFAVVLFDALLYFKFILALRWLLVNLKRCASGAR